MFTRTPFILALFAILCVIALLGGVFFGPTIQERLHRLPFEAKAWREARVKRNDTRIRMVDNLLRRHSFRGMTREEVTAIIGEPDKTEYFRDWDMVYWLGPERGFISIDSEWLALRLDSQKKVTDLRLLRD